MGKNKKNTNEKNQNFQFSEQKIDSKKLLPKLLKNENGVISKNYLFKLSFFDMFQLIEEISAFIITCPEKNVFFFLK